MMQSHPNEAFIDKFSRQLLNDYFEGDEIRDEETGAVQEVDTGDITFIHDTIFEEHIKALEWGMKNQISVAIIAMYHNESLTYHKGVPKVTRGSVPSEWSPDIMSPEDSIKAELFDPINCERTFCMEYTEDERSIVAVLTHIPDSINLTLWGVGGNGRGELLPNARDYQAYRNKQFWDKDNNRSNPNIRSV